MPSPISRRFITLGSVLKTLGIIALCALIVVYVRFQARNILSGPTIDLTKEYAPLQHERRLVISGTAHNIVKLTINGKEIHTDESGMFTHPLVLEEGYTIMEIVAQDRFGRTTSLQREYAYVPQ